MTTEQAKLEEIGILISSPFNDDTKEEMIEKIRTIILWDQEITEDMPYLKWAAKLQQVINPPPKDIDITFYQPDSDAAKFFIDYLDTNSDDENNFPFNHNEEGL